MNIKPSQAVGVPGEFLILSVNLPAAPGANMVQSTSMMDFDKVKHLLSDTPLRHQKRRPLK